ncbi:MAG TPA: tetratricopeptide repeat protein, partial [candidate division Zixibacteria bacterium]|nr:tetratricopeptide repeat protein [candidate division Zixibacteria bacterium]
YFYQGSTQGSLAEAHERMAKAKTDITVGNMQVALLELRNIADKNQGSDVGAEALYLLGSANFLNLNFAEARTAFEEYVKRYSKPSITNAAARAGIAACMENTGEYAPAAAEYLKALDSYPDGPAAQDYAIGALRCYLLAGDRAAASELRERITRDHWRTPAVTTADRLFHEIKPAG